MVPHDRRVSATIGSAANSGALTGAVGSAPPAGVTVLES